MTASTSGRAGISNLRAPMDKIKAFIAAYPLASGVCMGYLLGHVVGFLIGLQF